MIATIDIKVNAAHPNIPLAPLYAFVGSPSSVRILNVPQRVGKWEITAVSVTIALPDNSSTTVPAVAVCGYWVATLPSCDETGYCAAGLQVTASGTDENGNAVTGYCLGVGDVTILPRDATAVSNGTRYYLHYVAEQPEHPNPGDMCYIDGTPKWYDGTAWQTFAAGGSSVDVVSPSTDPADAGKAADAKATGDALAGKLSRAEAEAGFTLWSFSDGVDRGQPVWDEELNYWYLNYEGRLYCEQTGLIGDDATAISSWVYSWGGEDVSVPWTTTRTRLRPTKTSQLTNDGEDGGSPFASESGVFNLIDTIAKAIVASAFAAKAYAVDDLCVEDNVLYRCKAAYTATAQSASPYSDTAHWEQATIDETIRALGSRKADASALRYDLGAAQEIDSEAVETDSTDPENPIDYGSATMADRTANRVAITAAIDELRLTFPAAVSGKVRDFGLRLEIGSQLTAPALILPNGVTVGNPDGAIPEVADGGDNDDGVTLLYFSENAPGVFLVKGEQVEEVS